MLKNNGKGALSLITVTLQFGGSLARVFTTIEEVKDDEVVLLGFVSAAVLNGLIFLQCLAYKSNNAKASASASKVTKKKKRV